LSSRRQKSIRHFFSNHEVALYSQKGYIEWQGSESQKLAIKDLEEGLHNLTIKGGRNVKGIFSLI
jgi:hypothetical protein